MAAPDRYKPSNGPTFSVKLEAGDSVKRGDFVLIDADGYAVIGGDTASLESTIGIATEDADNSDGADGDVSVEVDIGGAVVLCTHSAGSQAQTNMNGRVHVDGPNAVDVYANVTNKNLAGVIIGVPSATTVWVHVIPAWMAPIARVMAGLADSASTNPTEAQYNLMLAAWR